MLRTAAIRSRTITSAAAQMKNLVVTWDVDGTLLGGPGKKKDNSAHKDAMDRAIGEVYGISGKVADVNYKGATDMAIVRDVCRTCNVPDDQIWEGMAECTKRSSEYIDVFIEDDMSDRVLPGVIDALTALNEHKVHCGLVTGNFEVIGWKKLERAGLKDFFQFGAFGSDCVSRNDILALALERASDRGFTPDLNSEANLINAYHVGDAIADIRAAVHVKGRGIGVLTGAFNREELEKERPYKVLADLSDTDAFLKLIGL